MEEKNIMNFWNPKVECDHCESEDVGAYMTSEGPICIGCMSYQADSLEEMCDWCSEDDASFIFMKGTSKTHLCMQCIMDHANEDEEKM